MTRREFRLPSLGDNVREVEIQAWRAEPGAHVARGNALCEVMSDKANVTFDAPEDLWLVEIVAPRGAVVSEGALLAVYDTESPASRAGSVYRAPAPPPAPSTRAAGATPHAFARVFSGAEWEPVVGYCRAVRAGPMIAVAGTTSVGPDGRTWAPGDAYGQARRCFEIIESALRELGASMRDVIRTRMFVTDIARWQEFGRAHGEFFRDNPPAATMVEVRSLIAPDLLIEIEVDAWHPR